MTVTGDMCQFGMTTKGADGVERPAMKPTKWATTSDEIAWRLGKRCNKKHQHGSLLDGKAAKAAEYPDKLCVEILKGTRDQ